MTENRTWKLAAEPILYGPDRQKYREIIQDTGRGRRKTFAVVPDAAAMDVLEAIRRAYQDGREDRAADITVATGDVIVVVPDTGALRTVRVTHAGRHVILLADVAGEEPA